MSRAEAKPEKAHPHRKTEGGFFFRKDAVGNLYRWVEPLWFRSSRIAAQFGLDRTMLAPLATAALLRFGLLAAALALTGTQIITQGDTASYLEPGRNLIFHGAFAGAGGPEIDRTPGYPIFAMVSGMAWGSVSSTCLVQILVSLASLLLVRKIADRVFVHRGAGRIATWLGAFEPLSIVSAIRLMPETLFVFLLLVVVERVLAFQQSPRLRALAIAGAFLAAATFVRPVSYYLGFALAVGLAVAAPRRGALRWKAPAVLLLAYVPWLVVWQGRNDLETGYRGFSSIVEQNLYFFQSAEVTAELQHISLGAEQASLGYPDEFSYLERHPEQRDWPEWRRLQLMRERSAEILSAHPLLYLKTHFAGVGVVALTPCATELLQLLGQYPGEGMPRRILNEGVLTATAQVIASHPGTAVAMAALEAYLLFLYVFAIRGWFFAAKDRRTAATLLWIAAYFLLISGGAQAIGRYRSPVMPELCVLAAGGLAGMRVKRGQDGADSELRFPG